MRSRSDVAMGSRPDLTEHPDRFRWDARYRAEPPTFEPHPMVAEAVRAGFPPGPVLELACGRSGSALALAAGHAVVAVDISQLALRQLAEEARHRSIGDRIACVAADVPGYDPGPSRFSLVLALRYWDATAFAMACRAVTRGGLLGWEALATTDDRRRWHLTHGELGRRLPEAFRVLREASAVAGEHRTTSLLARRDPQRS